MQRLHEDDLVGHRLNQEGWEVLAFPAIAECDEEHAIDTPFGPRRFFRRAGEALHPAREPLETLEQIRAILGVYNFASQYQQTPAPSGGGLVKESWFQRYGPEERPSSFDQIIQSWDTATKPTELADYSACTTWGLKGPHFYLLHLLRKKLAYPDLKRAVAEQRALFNPTVSRLMIRRASWGAERKFAAIVTARRLYCGLHGRAGVPAMHRQQGRCPVQTPGARADGATSGHHPGADDPRAGLIPAGMAGYFSFSQWRELQSLDSWIRRRLRCVAWVQWKTRGRRYQDYDASE
jgi:hypothetical protein